MSHGSRSTYDRQGCRCELCTAASTSAKRLQRERYRASHEIEPSQSKKWKKIQSGEVQVRKTADKFGAPVIAVTVHTLSVCGGDTVEITYGADEIVIRRAPLTSPAPAVP